MPLIGVDDEGDMRIFEKGNNGGSGGDDNDDDDSILKSDRNAGTFLSGAQRLD